MTALDLFVEEARSVPIGDALTLLPVGTLTNASVNGERVGPCPSCGGTDRFQVNVNKNAWLCRGASAGKDAIGLAAHVLNLDVNRREDFLLACAAVLGRDVPGDQVETEAEARLRAERLEQRRRENAEREAREQAASLDFRERERGRARGKWRGGRRDGLHLQYLSRRLDCSVAELPIAPFLRTIPAEAYWHDKDERGHALEIFEGPAMVAPFVDPSGLIVGCHLTWIDLTRRPKFRPRLQHNGQDLPSKKMRGSKKGGLIPLVGFTERDGLIQADQHRTRLVSGEGIENVLAVALAEGMPADTIYCAAGDLGNLAGPAEASSRFAHPEIRKPDKNGKPRPVFVAGPVPRADQHAGDAMQIPDHVMEVQLVADGDSEIYATASAMARAQARISTGGAIVSIAWPPEGMDFADLVAAGPSGH